MPHKNFNFCLGDLLTSLGHHGWMLIGSSTRLPSKSIVRVTESDGDTHCCEASS